MKTKLLFSVGSILLIILLGKVYLRVAGDFREGSIRHEIPFHPEWEVVLSSEENEVLDGILGQHFTYLDKGAQCYVFSSADDRWVLKIFKFKHLRLPTWLTYIPSLGPIKQYKERKKALKDERLEKVFFAHKLSFDRYREESGIFYIHLNPTMHMHRKIEITDKIGFHRTVDLDGLVFVVQEKSIPFEVELKKLLAEGDLETAKVRIRKMFALYKRQYELGIYDWGRGVMHNNGFVGDKAIHFDVEKIVADEQVKQPENYRRHLETVGMKIEKWLQKEFPEFQIDLKDEIQQGTLL